MTCLGVLERGDRDNDNETGLKERGGIEMSTTVLHSRAAPSLGILTLRVEDQFCPKCFCCCWINSLDIFEYTWMYCFGYDTVDTSYFQAAK